LADGKNILEIAPPHQNDLLLFNSFIIQFGCAKTTTHFKTLYQVVKFVLFCEELGLRDGTPVAGRSDGPDVATCAKCLLTRTLDDDETQFVILPFLQHFKNQIRKTHKPVRLVKRKSAYSFVLKLGLQKKQDSKLSAEDSFIN
jgi:hypothetical protein